jgi:hypothetical protein
MRQRLSGIEADFEMDAVHRKLQCVQAMEPRMVAVALSLLISTACGSFTAASPAMGGSSASLSPVTLLSPSPTPVPAAATRSAGPDVPAGLIPTAEAITGAVGPFTDGMPACYLERYNCEKYHFTMQRDGAVDVTLKWDGGSRAMLIQLYRSGAGLVHEDVAPKDGPPEITFRRVDITPMDYELRIVNMEPTVTHPFTLSLTTWE